MDLERFTATLDADAPPAGLSAALEALWWEARGDWHQAHRASQGGSGADTAWVHAYLHRREGDLSNAAYWYARADKPPAGGDLDQEWRGIASALLAARST